MLRELFALDDAYDAREALPSMIGGLGSRESRPSRLRQVFETTTSSVVIVTSSASAISTRRYELVNVLVRLSADLSARRQRADSPTSAFPHRHVVTSHVHGVSVDYVSWHNPNVNICYSSCNRA